MAQILVVDDEPHVVKMLDFKLKILGHEVITARDGDEALREVETKKPDLVLLDIMMPGMDGYQLLRKLKASEHYRDIPVVMLTAKGQEKDIVHGFDTGADDYVVKPFGFPELIARINRALDKGRDQ